MNLNILNFIKNLHYFDIQKYNFDNFKKWANNKICVIKIQYIKYQKN